MENLLKPLSMDAIFFSSTEIVIVSAGVLRTMSENSFALSTAFPGSCVVEGMTVVIPSSKS